MQCLLRMDSEKWLATIVGKTLIIFSFAIDYFNLSAQLLIDFQFGSYNVEVQMKKGIRLEKKSNTKSLKINLTFQDISFPPIDQPSKMKIEKISKTKDHKDVVLDRIKNKLEALTKRTNKNVSGHKRKESTKNDSNASESKQKKFSRVKQSKNGKNKQNFEYDGKMAKNPKNCGKKLSVKHKKEEATVEVKTLFNKIQDRLKSPHGRLQSKDQPTMSRSYSLRNILSKSDLISNTTNHSLMASPRQQFLIQKGQANRDVKSMIATIGHEISRLEELKQKNEIAIKDYMQQKIRNLDIDLYRLLNRQTISIDSHGKK